jgi:dephospho-CoA kinase
MNRPREPLVVTGGIGSGKSMVLSYLKGFGWTVIDADAVARTAVDSMVNAVVDLWPEAVSGAVIDRPMLARLVFAHSDELKKLERLVYPSVAAELSAWSRSAPFPAAVEISSPTYPVGAGSKLMVVDANDGLRRSRAVGRGMDPEDFERRVRLQPPRTGWLGRATFVVDNGGDSDRTEQAVKEFDRWWREQ